MKTTKLTKGTKVTFRGTAEDGRMVSAHEDGPDVFEATVDNELFGIDVYALVWPGNVPVGIPFARSALTVIG